MPSKDFPLRWESTGDQWWYASPIDWAAANGHYDVVRELLHIDPNLLIKLTSLPRITRLETVWDDEEKFSDVAKCRSQVAHKLLQDCETRKGHNSLIRAGYGGWLLYTAASAGDLVFVKELLDRNSLLVFGEGEYGVTDMFYAAARSKSSDVFRMLFDSSLSPRGKEKEVSSVFRTEMRNRAVHGAARGGNIEMLLELLGDCSDFLVYRDATGSTVLHTAAARGQVQVVKHLISSSSDIMVSVDNQGNTALNIAAYRGHLGVVAALISASPSSISMMNNYGDTFLHMAVSGFRSPSFRRLDQQEELVKQIVGGKLVDVEDIINAQNKDGRTALHIAVIDNIQSSIVQLLMSARYINLNLRDTDGKTPLDLLKQRPRSASSEMLIKQLISAGGISACQDPTARKALVSHLNMRSIGGSPGTSFRIRDADIFLYSGLEDIGCFSSDCTSGEIGYSGEIEGANSTKYRKEIGYSGEIKGANSTKYRKFGPMKSTTRHLKSLLSLTGKKGEKTKEYSESEVNGDSFCSVESYKMNSGSKNQILSLRQQFSRASSLANNKRIVSLAEYDFPSPLTKKKFAAGLSQGVLQVGSPSSTLSESPWSSPAFGGKGRGINGRENIGRVKKHSSFNMRLMNNYLCFGTQGLALEGKPE